MIVKIKKLSDKAVTPKYAMPGDAAMDLVAAKVEYDKKRHCFVYYSDLAFEVPDNHVMLLFPRSSNARTNAYLTNSVGIIDSSYRGNVMACYKIKGNDPDDSFSEDIIIKSAAPYQEGERFAQIMILPYPQITFEETDKLSDTLRGEGGYGSTGK